MEVNIDKLKEKELEKLSKTELDSLCKHYYDNLKKSKEYSSIVSILLAEKAKRQAKRISIFSLIISIAAIVIASISLYFSNLDYEGDKLWQNKQLNTLERVITELKK